MLTKSIVEHIELPHEQGSWIDVHPLGFRALRRAREVRTLEQIKLFSAAQQTSSDATLQAMKAAAEAPKPESTPESEAAADAARDADRRRKLVDINEYDLSTLLQEAIVAWSYDAPISPANIDDLDEATAEYVARRLLPVPETHEERKNG